MLTQVLSIKSIDKLLAFTYKTIADIENMLGVNEMCEENYCVEVVEFSYVRK